MAPLTPRALLLLLTTLLASPSFAGTKLDLSPYLGNLGTVGDFKVFAFADGGERRVTILAVEPYQDGFPVDTDAWQEKLVSGSIGGFPIP